MSPHSRVPSRVRKDARGTFDRFDKEPAKPMPHKQHLENVRQIQ